MISSSTSGSLDGAAPLPPSTSSGPAWARNRGWSYGVTWLQRGTGLLLVLYLLGHMLSLSALVSPERYNALMRAYAWGPLPFMEWALALPVMFHALNGGRLLLFELFGLHDVKTQMSWTWALVAASMALLGALMLRGDQQVSPLFFWLLALAGALALGVALALKLAARGHALGWKLHRISGAFLLVMIPAHFVFMHLNPQVAKEAMVVTARLQGLFIKLVDALLVAAAFYHAAYGLMSVARDYLAPGGARTLAVLGAGVLMVVFALVGLRLLAVV